MRACSPSHPHPRCTPPPLQRLLFIVFCSCFPTALPLPPDLCVIPCWATPHLPPPATLTKHRTALCSFAKSATGYMRAVIGNTSK